ncbi:uncharacterized protein LOC108676584 [Hyalella azteca]|uniref:Uncharacterized protein LOC108676584 n=1 Tax=Hyalella azteca TaxID=294128 RepID=A0A8B7P2C9_HYAAZ|nr:uncharacterized protein LOC108676584 [Hyalella azteca]
MSAQVTVHRMTTTTTTTAVLLNIGYLKTLPGILKLFQIVLGIVAVAITGHYIKWDSSYYESMVPELFFLLVATTCLITTTLLLLSCLCSIATASIIPKTLFETLYHIVASLLYLSAGLCFIIYLNSEQNRRYVTNYGPKTAAAAIGLVNTALYFLACFYSVRSYRRG